MVLPRLVHVDDATSVLVMGVYRHEEGILKHRVMVLGFVGDARLNWPFSFCVYPVLTLAAVPQR